MTESASRRMTRRNFMRALLATTALVALRPAEPNPDDIVEIGGWILKRSDLA